MSNVKIYRPHRVKDSTFMNCLMLMWILFLDDGTLYKIVQDGKDF
jgi:hypothetical protein